LDQDMIVQQVPRDLPLFLQARQQIALARVYLAQGMVARALATLGPLRVQEEAASRRANLIEIDLLGALALAARGKATASLETLERSLTLAKPEGYVQLYLEEGEPLVALLREVVARGSHVAWARRLLEASPSAPLGDAESTQVQDEPRPCDSSDSLIEPLTPRELEVLQLICKGLSNREISERLTVTLNTVKKHSSNLYGKLGVASRAQAIVRARELRMC
jgi:LuxR family maltose regulon positive regulatory protein